MMQKFREEFLSVSGKPEELIDDGRLSEMHEIFYNNPPTKVHKEIRRAYMEFLSTGNLREFWRSEDVK